MIIEFFQYMFQLRLYISYTLNTYHFICLKLYLTLLFQTFLSSVAS